MLTPVTMINLEDLEILKIFLANAEYIGILLKKKFSEHKHNPFSYGSNPVLVTTLCSIHVSDSLILDKDSQTKSPEEV